MRTIKVGAIQPGVPAYDARYDCLADAYVREPNEIVKGFIIPKLDITLRLLEQAGQAGCGIVTTSEDATGMSRYLIDSAPGNLFHELAARSAALAEERFSQLARRHGMYVIGCYFKPIKGAVYNLATVFDRRGGVAGEYRKTHLPPNETWQTTQGDELSVIPLDFGVIGISICYDIMFPEPVAVQAMKGAEIIFHPTAGYGWYDAIGEATLRVRANDNGVHIVTAKNYVRNAAGKSSVIDFWGQTRADAGFYENVIVHHELDLDAAKTQPPWFYPTQMSGIAEVTARKDRERRPELYGVLAERRYERLPVPSAEEQAILRERVRDGSCRW